MAHSDLIVQKQAGIRLEHVFLGVCAGMQFSAKEYMRLRIIQPIQALKQLKRAVIMPRRMRAFATAYIEAHGLNYLREALVLADCPLTLANMQSDLVEMETYTNSLIAAWPSQTPEQIATAILTQVPDEELIYNPGILRLIPGYNDPWEDA